MNDGMEWKNDNKNKQMKQCLMDWPTYSSENHLFII